MTDLLLITSLDPVAAKASAKRRGIRAAFVGTVNGKTALLAGMESYDRILAWWLEVRGQTIGELIRTASPDAMLDQTARKVRQPLAAVGPVAESPLHGVSLNGRMAP